jgi:hypothetical protein
MPQRTQLFQVMPWDGGLNTSVDESMIAPNQLTVADNVVFGTRMSRKKREGINHDWDDASSGSTSILGLHDFWYGSSGTRTQKRVAVASDGTVYSYSSSGARTTVTDGGTAYTGTVISVSMATFGNKVFIAAQNAAGTNVLKYWDGSGDVEDVPGDPPKASILRVAFGRILCNDVSNKDLLHYSPVGDYTQWNGADDSGAIPIEEGDGDPEGITAIFPSFKGNIFVAKRTKLYRVPGELFPDASPIIKITDGIGCVSHNSCVPIDQDDVFFVSERGVHSLAATDQYGDFSSSFVSVDIQKTFTDEIDNSRLKYVWGAYLPALNSVAFTFTEETNLNRALTSNAVNNTLYLFNIPGKAWYRWPDLPCQSIIAANDSDQKRFYLGTHTTRVSKCFNGSNYDVSAAGTNTAIRYKLQTGQLFPDSSPYTIKGLKRFILFYRPRGTHTISATIKVDNIPLDNENTLSFSETGSSNVLGSVLTLGSAVLGYDFVLGPYTRHIDGVGRGLRLTIEQNGIDEEVEIQGFAIEYEPAGTGYEIY